MNIPLLVEIPPAAQAQASANWMPPIQLVALDPQALQPTIWPQMDNSTPQPSRFFADVRPGSYRVAVLPMGTTCVQSVSSGGQI